MGKMEMKIILVLTVLALPVNAKGYHKLQNILNTLQNRVKRDAGDTVYSKGVDTYYGAPVVRVSEDSMNETITTVSTEEPEVTTYGSEISFVSLGNSDMEGSATTAGYSEISFISWSRTYIPEETTEVPYGSSSYVSSYEYSYSSGSPYISVSSYSPYVALSTSSLSSEFSLPPIGSSTVSFEFEEPFKNKNDKDSSIQQSYSSLSSYSYWSSSPNFSSSIRFEWPVIGNGRVDKLKKKTDLLKQDVFDKLLKLKSLRDKEQKVENEVENELDRGQMLGESIAKMMIRGPSGHRRSRK